MNRIARSTALAAACSACAGSDSPATSTAPAAPQTSSAPMASQPTTSDPPDSTEPASTEPASQPASSQSAGNTVNPAQYLGTAGIGEGHFFTTGPLRCGLGNETAGCQSTELVANLPQCASPDSQAPLVTMGRTGTVTAECTSQGMFVTESAARELPVGATLTVRGWACTAIAKGSVRCASGSGGALVANSQGFAKA